MSKTENNSGYALITGATSGIGYELAKLFAADGYNLALVARSEERLQQVAAEMQNVFGVKVVTLAKDLFRREAADEIYSELNQQQVKVTALVNDAGQGEWGFFKDTDLNRELDIIQLNIGSLVALTKYYLKDMIERNEGKILQLASIVSEMPAPLLSVYAGTKAFVLSFSEALANELKDTDVTITALQPGATDTDFFFKAGQEDTVTYQETKLSDPADVARDGYEAMKAGRLKVVSGMKNKMQSAMSNITPDSKLASSMRKQNELSDEQKRTHSDHDASAKEREMINSSTHKYKGRDLAHDEDKVM